MHPLLADRKRLALYLAVWLLVAMLLALLVLEPGRNTLAAALLLMLPPTALLAFVCLAAWYPVHAMPLSTARAGSLLATHLLAAVVVSAAWTLSLHAWERLVAETALIASRRAVLLVTGALLYLLAVAVHYLIAGLEHGRRVEKQAMEVKVLAREAELKVLKAQLDPHFLFNSLNSISSLCGSNPSSARTLTTLLAEYLRKSLRIGSAEAITLSEELELVSSYLAIERIRFGPRLELDQAIEESVRSFRVPPLLLQPVVENAVTHGIGHLLEGGVVRIAAAREGAWVRIRVENPCDADRPASRGTGIGLMNLRKRIEIFYGSSARVEAAEEGERFVVALTLPA